MPARDDSERKKLVKKGFKEEFKWRLPRRGLGKRRWCYLLRRGHQQSSNVTGCVLSVPWRDAFAFDAS
jgi:hypothetical protein